MKSEASCKKEGCKKKNASFSRKRSKLETYLKILEKWIDRQFILDLIIGIFKILIIYYLG